MDLAAHVVSVSNFVKLSDESLKSFAEATGYKEIFSHLYVCCESPTDGVPSLHV
jgi:hypothetical protein